MSDILAGAETILIGLYLEGFLCGVYSGIFAMYFQYQAAKKDIEKTQNYIMFYSMCVLYVLSVTVFFCDIAEIICGLQGKSILPFYFIQTTSFGCSDFIAQFILIYRCWIVWGRDFRIVIIPSVLAVAFLATWLTYSDSGYISIYQPVLDHGWWKPVLLTSLAMSLAVNALVTGLIVLRILNVFRQVKATSDDHILASTGGNKLQRIIFVLVESGMALFSIQLARMVTTVIWTDAAFKAFAVISAIHQMLNGITPTIIMMRTSMGLSFHNEKSMEEVAIGSLRFAPNDLDSVPEMENINNIAAKDDDYDTDVEATK